MSSTPEAASRDRREPRYTIDPDRLATILTARLPDGAQWVIDDFARSQPKYAEHIGSLDCPCHPYRDAVEPSVVIHRKHGES